MSPKIKVSGYDDTPESGIVEKGMANRFHLIQDYRLGRVFPVGGNG